jgi:hypothetical protein
MLLFLFPPSQVDEANSRAEYCRVNHKNVKIGGPDVAPDVVEKMAAMEKELKELRAKFGSQKKIVFFFLV